MDGLARLAGLSPQERARLLATLRPPAGTSTSGGHPLRPRPAGTVAPASFLQEQMWFLDQLVGPEPVYNVPFSFLLRGPVQPERLLAAAEQVLARHEVLRSTLVLRAGRLRQEVAPSAPPVRLSEPADPDTRLRELSRTRFDLARGPLVRVELLREHAQAHRLVWVAHHAVVDGWSLGLLVDELRAAYLGTPLSPVALHFGDVAHWQRERDAAGELDAVVRHWRDELAGLDADPEAHAVPPDRPRPDTPRFRGATVPFTLPDELAAALHRLARARGTTLFATLLAGWQVLVAASAGADESVVGVPVAGRSRPELEAVVGPLSNTVPLRTGLGGDPDFATVLGRVSTGLADAAGRHEVPLGRLVAGRSRDVSRNPLFCVVFNFDTLPSGPAARRFADGVELTAHGHPNGTARMDLELTVEQSGTGLAGRLDHDTALYDRATARRLVDRWQALLTAAAADPGRRLSALPHGRATDRASGRATGRPGGRSAGQPTGQAMRHPAQPPAPAQPSAPTRLLISDNAARIGDWLSGPTG